MKQECSTSTKITLGEKLELAPWKRHIPKNSFDFWFEDTIKDICDTSSCLSVFRTLIYKLPDGSESLRGASTFTKENLFVCFLFSKSDEDIYPSEMMI